MNEKGHWELVSPLPDCPVGTKGVKDAVAYEDGYWHFATTTEFSRVILYKESEMRRNPDIFRWVPEPEEDDPIMEAWSVIANAGHTLGGWPHEHPEWVKVAEQWRDKWLGKHSPPVRVLPVPKPEPERVEWPEPPSVYCPGDPPYRVSVDCAGEVCASIANALRAVLQALREGKTIYASKDEGNGMLPTLIRAMFEPLIRPDGSRP